MKLPFFRSRTESFVTHDIPIPPPDMRALVGPTDAAAFDNPEGLERYPGATRFFDFGCGCGRIARQLIQQKIPLQRYMGIDLHAGMVRWCNQNLAPVAPQFEFKQHDAWNVVFNPNGTGMFQPL